MADIITTLHPENDTNTNLYPNIKNENITKYSLTKDRLEESAYKILSYIAEESVYNELSKSYEGNTKFLGYAGSGGLTSNNSFVTYYFVATKDFRLYCDLSDLGDYGNYYSICTYSGYPIDATTFLNRYRLSENNLPTENSKVSISANNIVAITIQNRDINSDFIILQDMVTEYDLKLKNGVLLNETQLNQIRNDKSFLEKEANNINVFLKVKNNNYVKLTFNHYINNNINEDTWRLYGFTLLDNSFNNLWSSNTNIEWEGVIKEHGTSDFIGGYHGDENYYNMLLFIDGNKINENDVLTKTYFNNIKIIVNSYLNRCNTPNDNVINRTKVIELYDNTMIITNRWVFLQDLHIEAFYPNMMSLLYSNTNEGVKMGMYNDYYQVQDLSDTTISGDHSPYEKSEYATIASMWDDRLFSTIEINNNYAHKLYIDTYQSTQRKVYAIWNGSTQFYENDDLTTSASYTFE